jgi:hypothetical protein
VIVRARRRSLGTVPLLVLAAVAFSANRNEDADGGGSTPAPAVSVSIPQSPPPHAESQAPDMPAQSPAPPERIAVRGIELRFWPVQHRLAGRLAELIEGLTLPALPRDVLDGSPPIMLVLAPDEERFATLTGGRVPHWGAGVAFPQSGVIVIPVQRAAAGGFDDVARITIHELAHVALQRRLGEARIPRWFTEGYATWAAGQLDFEAGWLLRIAFVMRRAPPLDSLALGWPTGVTDARVAYLLSATVLEHLYAEGGEFALRRFLDRWADGHTMEEALFLTYGYSMAQLERSWSRAVRRRYGWTVFFSQATVIWTLLTLMVLALFVIRRRRDRRRMAALRASEIADTPAFWIPGYDDNAGSVDAPPVRPAGEDSERPRSDSEPARRDEEHREPDGEQSSRLPGAPGDADRPKDASPGTG